MRPEKGRFVLKKDLTKKIVGTACFAALSFVVSFLEIPIFPAAGFLKLDFSSVFVMLSGFTFGPVYGVFTTLIKELLCLTKSSTGGIGEIANFCCTTVYIIVPSVTYCYHKGLKMVIPTLIIGCFLQTGVAVLLNRFLLFPLFFGQTAAEAFSGVWYYVLAFNLIKTAAVSVITLLVYKRISTIIKKI